MNLKYKILWVDDKIDDYKSLDFHSDIENHLKEVFFTPILNTCESVEEAKEFIKGGKHDLILSDYNIDKDKGDDFIRHVRQQQVNTEILFYSAQETVPGLDIDRISFFSIPKLDGYPQLLDKIKKLINLTIEKSQELVSIRGLVMAETSQLDKLMEEIIILYFVTQKSDERDSVFEEIINGLEADHKNKLKKPTEDCKDGCSHKIREKDYLKIIVSRDFESSRKARAIKAIIEKQNFNYNTDKNFYEDYLAQLIIERNNLAHSYSEEREGVEILITKNKDAGEIIFDEEKFRVIRQNILKYAAILNELKRSLQ